MEDLLRRALHDTTRHRQAGVLFQKQVHLASSLATLIDTPR